MRQRNIQVTCVCLALLALTLLQASPVQFQPETATAGSKSTASAGAVLLSPVVERMDFQGKPPQLTPTQLQALQSSMKHLTPPTPKGAVTTYTGTPAIGQSAVQTGIKSLSDFSVFTNETVQVPSTPKSLVNEPSIAQKNGILFYTGNWYAARSSNSGQNWTYRDPFADMSDFCCDQDALYNPSRGIFLWYRMGKPLTNGTNRFRLGVSSDASLWFFYDVHPDMINPFWTNQIFDFIVMAHSDNYLYITNNIFQNNTYTDSLVLRMSLDSLKNHSSFSARSFIDSNAGFAPVQGAKQTMYFASHITTSLLRLYVWPESSLSLTLTFNIIHPPFTSTNPGVATCQAPDGGDICKRLDDRVLGGWVANGLIGFVWSVAQGGPYLKPYTYILRINETSKTLKDTSALYNTSYAWVYAWVSPNARGDLGLVAYTAGSSRYPRIDVGIQDSASNNTWQFYPGGVITSTNGPETSCINGSSDPCWGDFIRVRAYNGTGNAWIASAYTLEGGRSGQFVQPYYIVFGHLADDPYKNATVTFHTVPSVVGSITFNGTTYTDSQSGLYNVTGSYSARANIPPNYTFSLWNSTGGLIVSSPETNPTSVTVLGPGSLIAILIPPNITITFRTNPSSAGSITCSGQTFINGQTGRLPANSTITCRANPPVGFHLASWGGLASGKTQTVSFFSGNGGTLTANFAVGAGLPPITMLATSILAVAILWVSRRKLRFYRF